MELESEITFDSDGLPKSCFSSFQKMKSNGKLCDVTFRVADETIKAHRVIIAAAIPYFEEKFFNGDTGGEEIEIGIPEISEFKLLIEFAYSCKVKITVENVKSLLAASSYFCVDQVRIACCDFLSDRLTPENVLDVRDLACSHNCAELIKETEHYVRENFCSVSQTKAFLNCAFDYVKDLVCSDDLQVSSEEIVFEAAINWVKASPDERKSDLPELLGNIRLSLLPPLYLRNRVSKEELIRTSLACRDLLDDARDYHLLPEISREINTSVPKPRCFVKSNYVEEANENQTICRLIVHPLRFCLEYFNEEKNMWHNEVEKSIRVIGSVVKLDDKIYFLNSGELYEYDVKDKTLNFCTRRMCSKVFVGIASLNNKLYACGGSTAVSRVNTVDVYDPEKDQWRKACSMHVCRSSHGVVTLDNCIYVMGGRDETSVHSSVERYDPDIKKWTVMPSMHTRRYGLGCAALNGKIYACGGLCKLEENNCMASAEVYDPVENVWTLISAMNTSRRYCALIPYMNKLYALGGQDDQNVYLNSVEGYDAENDRWMFNNVMKTKFEHCRGVVVISTPVVANS